MVFGTFDLLHPGHVDFLNHAKKLGDYLVAVVARDTTVERVKGRLPQNSEQVRKINLEKLHLADKVILGNFGDKFKVIADEQPHVIALGYDQKSIVEDLEQKVGAKVTVVRLKPFKPEIYKSSKLKNPLT